MRTTHKEMLDFFNAVADALDAHRDAEGAIDPQETVDTIELLAQSVVARSEGRVNVETQSREA